MEDIEGREHFLQTIAKDMLENFSDYEKASRFLFLAIREGNELPLNVLNKLYELSLENKAYKDIYDFYMKEHDCKGTAYEHIQQLMAKEKGKKTI
jgi:hypothetical protein